MLSSGQRLTSSDWAWEFLTFFLFDWSLHSKYGGKKERKNNILHTSMNSPWSTSQVTLLRDSESFLQARVFPASFGLLPDPKWLYSSSSQLPVIFLIKCLLLLQRLVKWNTFKSGNKSISLPFMFSEASDFSFFTVSLTLVLGFRVPCCFTDYIFGLPRMNFLDCFLLGGSVAPEIQF